MTTPRVTFSQISGSPSQMADLQRIFEEAPDYSMRIMGHPPGQAEAQSTYTILPPDKDYKDKFVYSVYLGNKMIGCVDLVRGNPDSTTAMLGLLLLSEKYQSQGYGCATYEVLESSILNWPEIKTVRIGVVATNSIVIPFWKKMGFMDTGIRKPYRYDQLESEHWIFEKTIKERG